MGLHEFYGPTYQYPSKPLVEDLFSAGGNYPIPDIALVTHYHRDHFSTKLLNKLSGTLVIGPKQVTDSLSPGAHISLRTVPYMEFERNSYQVRNLSMSAFRMDHVNRSRHQHVQNIGYLIDLGGYSVLHVGDTDWHGQMFEKLELKAPIDIAILPVWMLLTARSRAMIRDYLSPQYLIVTHVDPQTANTTVKQIRQRFPNSLILTQLGETHTF